MKRNTLKALGTIVISCMMMTACGEISTDVTAQPSVAVEENEQDIKELSAKEVEEVEQTSDNTDELSEDKTEEKEDTEESEETEEDLTGELRTEEYVYRILEDDTVMLLKYLGDDETDIVVPSTIEGKDVTVIGKEAFDNHGEIVSVVLPDTLKEIGEMAFLHCDGLEHIDFGKSLEKIGSDAFESLSLKEVKLPNTIKELGEDAFRENAYTELVIPASLETIGNGAFANSDIRKLTIPGNIKTVSAWTFNGCSSLEEVIIEEGVEIIDTAVFEDCESLKKVTIASTVTTINEDAFRGCSALKDITIPKTVTEINQFAFYTDEDITIHTPKGSYAEAFAKENEIAFVNN